MIDNLQAYAKMYDAHPDNKHKSDGDRRSDAVGIIDDIKDILKREVVKPEPETREKLVIWSGGRDSTLVLAQLCAERHRKLNGEGFSIYTLSIQHQQISDIKLQAEKTVRARFTGFAKAKWNADILNTEVKVQSSGYISPTVGESPQATLWLCTMMPYVNSNTEVYLGYIRHDDFWYYKNEYQSSFQWLAELRHLKNVSLCYPLEWHEKIDVIQELEELKIPDNCVWWCENPSIRDLTPVMCGDCGPCKHSKEAVLIKNSRIIPTLDVVSKDEFFKESEVKAALDNLILNLKLEKTDYNVC